MLLSPKLMCLRLLLNQVILFAVESLSGVLVGETINNMARSHLPTNQDSEGSFMETLPDGSSAIPIAACISFKYTSCI